MKTRMLLTLALCLAVAVISLKPVSAIEKELEIGSKAPPLDIEHWIQDGNGFFKPVTEFESGKVYVVEFWATWCGPCIGSMPHLAEIQNKYRGRGVQIVSVSDETLDEVKDLLPKDHPQAGTTFQELTSAYCLTTDPDRSVHVDYMEAAGQNGIPTSFIVGKTSQIEWIGHPMEMDEPLEAVVTDSWDREKFKEELRLRELIEENMQKAQQMAAAGQIEAALEVVEDTIKVTKDEQYIEQMGYMAFQLRVSAGKLDPARAQIVAAKGNALNVARFGFVVNGMTRQGAETGTLVLDSIKAIEAEMDGLDDEQLAPLLSNTIAQLHEVRGDFASAIKAQESAIAASTDDRQKAQLERYLGDLKKQAAAAAEAPKE